MKQSLLTPVVLAFPGIALGVSGLFHPHTLTPDSADRWFVLHVAGLVVFPLVGVAFMVLVRGRQDALAWLVRALAFTYATFYTALDVIYGVAAGNVTRQMDDGYRRSADFSAMLRTAVDLGEIGSWALIGCAITILVDQVGRHRVAGLPAVALPVGAWLVHSDHIFSPEGAAGMALIGLATGALARNIPRTHGESDATLSALKAS